MASHGTIKHFIRCYMILIC